MYRRLAAAATLGVTLLLAACTDDAPKPPPPPTPGPTMPSETPSPSPSPTLSQDDLDKAAVEKAYRIQFAEFDRLEMAGGATRLTQKLLDTTSGQHQKHYLTWLKEDKAAGQRQMKPATLVGVVAGSGNSTRRKVTACEDYSRVTWTRHGKPYDAPGATRDVQHATAVKDTDGQWKIALVETTTVKVFNPSTCGGKR